MSGNREDWERHLQARNLITQDGETAPGTASRLAVTDNPLGVTIADSQAPASPPSARKAKGIQTIGEGGINKTERRYIDEVLWPRFIAKEILWFSAECVKRRISIPGKRCWYLPDFEVMNAEGFIEYHEVKGGWVEDDARVKFLAAQRIYPMFNWQMWQWKQNEWRMILSDDHAEKSRRSCGFL